MKKLLLLSLVVFFIISSYAQVPVTFHYKPEYTQFTKLRLVGTFNNWNNADDALLMNGPNGNGEYEITVNLPTGVDHNYKFVMDADWGLAFSDPDNPRINLTDANNSILMVKDPMITYLVPRDVNSRSEKFIDNSVSGLPIRAIFAFTDPVTISSLSVNVDGVDITNPSQYYNAAKKEFLYIPNPALTIGEHTVTVSITSPKGTDTKTSTFIRDPNYVAYQIPVDFYYDQNNTSVAFTQALSGVSLVGAFNNWNDTFNQMYDTDHDGLWETTAILTPAPYEYKFKLNKIYWTNDPDEPKVSNTTDANSIIEVIADSIPEMKLLQPSEGTVYTLDIANVILKVLLRPGVKSAGVDIPTIQLKVDAATKSFNLINDSLTSSFTIMGTGRHTVDISYKNKEGLSASEKYSFGIYTKNTGVYIVDSENDEQYNYRLDMDGRCDILSVNIDETTNHDSLRFKIQMKDIGNNIRLGFIISNPSQELINDPKGLDIKTINWNGQGIFAAIGAPGSPYINTATENRIMTSSNPPVYSNILLNINSDASTTNVFDFKISIALMDSIIGSWTQQRVFYVFSYLVDNNTTGNSYEVGTAENGSANDVDPDIYDAAFTRSGFWQNRMLSNYIPAGEPNGPHIVALDGKGRGLLSLGASDISDSLATFGPEITFLTPGLEYWYSNLTVHGKLSDTTIATVEAYYNNVKTILPVTAGKFSMPVTLKEGDNIFYVIAEDNRGYKSISRNLLLTYKPDNLPSASISGTVSGRQVTLTVTASSPAGTQFNYTWTADSKNPVIVSTSSTTSSVVLNIPTVEGEYFFNVRVRDSKNKIVNPRVMIVSKKDSVYIPGLNDHPAWVDDAIVYEIYPRSFSQQGGFQGVTDKINYLKSLGINTIWFMPIYKGPTTHGYEITDYYDFEEDYGNEASFRTMLAALKNNGIKVILDFVVNHTSVLHPFMQNVFKYYEYSPYANFYNWEGAPGSSNYQFLFDWSSLPNLNHNNPDVRKYFIDVAKYWVTYYGIDGYRCDVAWGVEERNNQFWKEWRQAIKNVKPEVFLEAEASSDQPVFYDKRFDSANDWPLRNDLLGVLNGTITLQALHQEVTRTYPNYARPFRFLENHDENRVPAVFDTKRSLLLHTVTFTLNGVPLIYSGGEVGEATRREMINWSDPDHLLPYFKKLIDIRKTYIHNPVINLINNSENANVYSYSSTSLPAGQAGGDKNIVTAANFKDAAKNITLDISALPFDGVSNYYLTDLINGTVFKVTPAQRNAVPVILNSYQAKVFYYGLDSVVVVGVEDKEDQNIITEYKLYQNYPNPFNPTTKIKYQVKQADNVTVKIYDMLGAEVKTLVNEVKSPGLYEVEFNASNLASGIYFYRMQSGSYVDTKKLMLLK